MVDKVAVKGVCISSIFEIFFGLKCVSVDMLNRLCKIWPDM
jgi:hypothetical protein